MRLGILSDSHGRVEITGRAVRALRDRGADVLVHLGDVESEAVIDELVGRPAHLVLGNCDELELIRYAEFVGVTVDHPMGRLECDGAVVAFTHGHLPKLMQQACDEGVAYLLHGHTHMMRDERVGATRIINPGALHRASRYTAALLDTATGVVEFVDVGGTQPG